MNLILDEPCTRLVPLVSEVHNDNNAFIWEGVQHFKKHFFGVFSVILEIKLEIREFRAN